MSNNATKQDLQELKDALLTAIPTIVKAEIQAETNPIKQDVSIVKRTLSNVETEVYRLGVLYEDLNNTIIADSELLLSNLNVKDTVDNQADRLTKVEATQALLVATVTEHSKKLQTV